MTRRIVLWRHGRTQWNAEGRAQGQRDIALDEVGVGQARDAAARLASLRPAFVVASDLQRARATGEALGRLTGQEVRTDPRLREIAFGEREGLTMRESWDRWPDLLGSYLRSEDVRFPGGETWSEVGERFAAALADVAGEMGEDDTVVVAAHGGCMRVGAARFLGLPQDTWTVLGGFDNCAWAVLAQRRLGWRIEEWNAGSLPDPVADPAEDDTVGPAA